MDGETYDRLLNRYGRQTEILKGYLAQGLPTTPFIDELLVAIALGHEDKDPRALAKKILKKHGSAAANEALKLRPRVNYTANKWLRGPALANDLAELSVEGFSTAVFSKYVAKLTGHKGGLRTFFDKASEAQLHDYFITDCYSEDRASIQLTTGTLNAVRPRAIEALFGSIPEIADQVTSVYICSHDTVTIPPKVTALVNVERFVIAFAGAIEGLEHLYELSSLECLELTHCKLATLPEGIAKLDKLVTLDLSSCENLTALPPDIAGLRALRKLGLFHCDLRELPDGVAGMTELVQLELRNNEHLETIPAGIGELPNLTQSDRALIHEEFFKVAKDPYEAIFESFSMLIGRYEHLPSVVRARDEYLATRNGPKAHIPELILAACRCYYDHEHGWSSNKFWAGKIDELGPEPLGTANRVAAIPDHYTKSTSTKAHAACRKRLATVEGFDVEVFSAFVEQMVFDSGNAYIDDEQP